MRNLNKRNVVITGGGSGIGRRIAINMAREGGCSIVWDIDADAVTQVVSHIEQTGGRAIGYICDVSDRRQIYQVADTVKQDVGAVDILINNAGVVSGRPFLECTDEQNIKTMEVNIMAHFWTVKAFLPDMIAANRGHLVTIASAGGLIGPSSLADYAASKFAAVGFNESIRAELRRKGVTGVQTTVVCPFFIDTGMFAGVKTKFSSILPILKEKDVANKVVQAVKRNKAQVIMPPFVHVVPLARMLPPRLFDMVADFFGINQTMDEFVGRKSHAANTTEGP